MANLILHVCVFTLAIFTAIALLRRYALIRNLGGNNPTYLLWWGIGLLLSSIGLIMFLVWDLFPTSYYTLYLQGAFPFLAIVVILVFTFPMLKIISEFKLFWPIYSVLFVFVVISLTTFPIYYYSRNLSAGRDIVWSVFTATYIIAPLELFASFLIMMIAFTTLGKHFWRWRFGGFILISFSLIGLAALNLARPYVESIIISGAIDKIIYKEDFLAFWRIARELLFIPFVIGFYLATMPRKIRADHTEKISFDGQAVAPGR